MRGRGGTSRLATLHRQVSYVRTTQRGEPIRVAFFHHYSLSHGGGGERFVLELAEFLARRGHEVSIHALPFRRRHARFELASGATYCERILHRESADVAYHMYAPLTSHLFLCRGPKIAGLHGAVVADYESSWQFYFRQGPFVAGAYLARETLGRIDLDRFDAIHAVSPVPVEHRRKYVLPNWVDRSNTPRALAVKRQRSKKFAVLYVGKPSYTKGFDMVTALSRSLSREGVEFWAAAPPDPRFDGNPHVKWLGYVSPESIWELYANASVLLHPTRQETFGRAILESVAAGTPVITTPIPSHVSLNLPLEYASSLPEMKERLEDMYDRWQTDYDDYYQVAQTVAMGAEKYDRRSLLPQYEQMLREVADGSSAS